LGERPILLQDYTSSKQLMNAAFDRVFQHRLVSKLPVEKRLSRGLQEAAEHVRGVQNSEACRAIILISDLAEKTGNMLVSPEAVRAMIEPLPIIFCWNRIPHLAPQVFSEAQYSLDKVSPATLVGLTGGEFGNRDWKTFIERMRGRYSIAYLPFAKQREGQVVKIKVELKPSAKRNVNDLVLTYPRIAIIPTMK
jgi:hypothetical protein